MMFFRFAQNDARSTACRNDVMFAIKCGEANIICRRQPSLKKAHICLDRQMCAFFLAGAEGKRGHKQLITILTEVPEENKEKDE